MTKTKIAKGFTLIELLVVIVIIGILATLATVTLGSARGKARDARRVSDVKQIQTALELYYNDAGGYPNLVSGDNPIYFGSTTYMTKVPNNAQPVDTSTTPACLSTMATYPYSGTVSFVNGYMNTSYSLGYCLGGTTGSISAGTHVATPGSIMNP